MNRFLSEVCTLEWHHAHDLGVPPEQTIPPLVASPSRAGRAHLGLAPAQRGDGRRSDRGIRRDPARAQGARRAALRADQHGGVRPIPAAAIAIPFLRWFDGTVVSGFEGVAKPDPRIFELLLDRFGLTPPDHAIHRRLAQERGRGAQHGYAGDSVRVAGGAARRGWSRPACSTPTPEMAPNHETIFTMEATPVKFGRGASAEAGWELRRLGVRRAMLVTDPGVAAAGYPERVQRRSRPRASRSSCTTARASSQRSTPSRRPSTTRSSTRSTGSSSVGGGSSIDTAKVANLVSTHPAPVMDYVNPPVGEGRKPPSPLKPHLAIPRRREPARRRPPWPCSTFPTSRSRRASPTATCAPPRPSSIPT